MKYNHLNVPTHWQNYWTRFPEGHTILEALISWVSQVDDMVDNQNQLNETVETYGNRLDEFIGKFDTQLQETVEQTLSDWQKTGFLDVIINTALDTKYHEMDNRLTSELTQTKQNKVDKDGNEQITMKNLSLEIKQALTSGVWDVNVNTSDIENGAVSIMKTDFLKHDSVNLFDKTDLVAGGVGVDGVVDPDQEGYLTTNALIPVKPNTTYTSGNILNRAFYDRNGAFVEYFNFTHPKIFTTSSNSYFIRYSIFDEVADSEMLVEGSFLPGVYTPHSKDIIFEGVDFSIKNIENKSITADKIAYLENTHVNLFDKTDLVAGGVGAGGVVDPDQEGYLTTNALIPVKPNTTYTSGNILNRAFYDRNGAFVEYFNFTHPKIFTTSSNSYFIRYSIFDEVADSEMFVEGNNLPNEYIAHNVLKLAEGYSLDLGLKDIVISDLEGKSVSIMGDSISTFKGWIPPDRQYWYSESTSDGTEVLSATQTWWYQLLKETGMKLLTNDSWSGSSVANATNNGDTDESHRSFINRYNQFLGSENVLKEKPDVIIIFGGTNDSNRNTTVGTAKYSSWTEEDLKTFGGSFSKLLNDLIYWNPTARIINVTSAVLKPEYQAIQKEVCDHFNIDNVELGAYSSVGAHPDIAGMSTIKNTIKNAL